MVFVHLLFSRPIFNSPFKTKHKINDAEVYVVLILGKKWKCLALLYIGCIHVTLLKQGKLQQSHSEKRMSHMAPFYG